MENASKALLMAAGVLIALMILGALILMFTKVGQYNSQSDNQKKQSEIAAFNNQFEPYNGKNLTLMDLKSLYSKIDSNNERNPTYPITINNNNNLRDAVETILTQRIPGGSTSPNVINFFDNFKEVEDVYKMRKVFAICTGMNFDGEGGRISNVNIP